jgi:hypothetical protein
MKKTIPFLLMASAIALVVLLGRTDGLLAVPTQSPSAYLASMPYVSFQAFGREFVLIQPSSTVFVYLLGLLTVVLGLLFCAGGRGRGQRSRGFWGIGLVLWGLGALAAGTSYQAFGYMLKGARREYMLFTSDFELIYLLLTCYAIDFMVAAVAHAAAEGKGRRFLKGYAVVHAVVYSAVLLVGAVLPDRFLVSYEGFMAMNLVNFLLMFGFSVSHHRRTGDRLNRDFAWLWVGFLGVNIGYFIWLFSGIPESLYARYGLWFNANDVLHLLLLGWMVAAYLRMGGELQDAETAGVTISL